MDPIIGLAALSVMAAVFIAAMALQQLGVFAGGKAARQRLEVLMRAPAIEQPASGAALREERIGRIPGLSALISSKEWATKTALDLDRADLRLRVSEFVAIRLLAALIAFGLMVIIFRGQTIGLLAAVAGAGVGYMLPAMWVRQRKQKRIALLESQLEETLTLTSSALKSGFGLLQSLESAATQMKHPISTEFQRAIRDINIGSSAEEALLALSERCGSYDLDIVITAIMIQRTVGGNLGEILDQVAHTMRERARIRGEITTLTSQQRLTGYILGGLPVAVGGLLFVVSSDYITPLFTETAGQVMLGGAAVMELIGVLIIKRILNIEV